MTVTEIFVVILLILCVPAWLAGAHLVGIEVLLVGALIVLFIRVRQHQRTAKEKRK